jgi:hypothetical protein
LVNARRATSFHLVCCFFKFGTLAPLESGLRLAHERLVGGIEEIPPTTATYLVNGRLLLLGDRSLTGIRDIHGATGLEDFLRTIALFAVLGTDGEQDVPVFDLPLVAFRLILGNTHADKRSGKASGYVRL